MSTQSDIEKVMRSLHVLLSKCEPYGREPGKVIVDKKQVLDLLSELNACVYRIMDDYELTTNSRDKAEREFRKQADQIIWDASRKAEDIYAASVLYMDDALSGIQDIMRRAREAVNDIYTNMEGKLKDEEQRVRTNQTELKGQLQDLVDSEKYLSLIEERNREREKQKKEKAGSSAQREKTPSIYANRQTEIKINQAFLDRLGMSVPDGKKSGEKDGESDGESDDDTGM